MIEAAGFTLANRAQTITWAVDVFVKSTELQRAIR
jgi:hypothetical protein